MTSSSLVIGSAQPPETIDAAALRRWGIEITRRPAGGGAVLVVPGAQVWIDAWVPRSDPLWEDDLVHSARWLGGTWASALCALGAKGADVHRSRSVDTPWSRLVCFAGLGPGEVTVDGAKIVGLAQRRTRDGARFLTVAHMSWDASSIVRLLALGRSEKDAALAHLRAGAAGLTEVLHGGAEGADGRPLVESVERAIARALP